MKKAIIILLVSLFISALAGCTNRQLYDRWEARGLRRHWMDTTSKPEGVIVQDSAKTAAIVVNQDAIVDSLVHLAMLGKLSGINPIYINNDTCINETTAEALIKWKVLPPITNNIYKSFNFEDKNILCYLEYDKNGNPEFRYKIKVDTKIVPVATPTAWEQVKHLGQGLGDWLKWIIIGALCLAALIIYSYFKK